MKCAVAHLAGLPTRQPAILFPHVPESTLLPRF